MTLQEVVEKKLFALADTKYLKILLAGMLVSYFYNLAVFNYSLTGNNELRLYDFLGLAVLYYYFNNRPLIDYFIKKRSYLYYLAVFIRWCMITMILTFIISFLNGKNIWILRTILFMYHFVVFFLSGIFFMILMKRKKNLKLFIYLHLIMTLVAGMVVILQNIGIVPYLWSELDRQAYGNFYSGILGPNKIVLGMVMMLSLITFVGIYLEKNIKINKILLMSGILIALFCIGISGSRTSYTGVAIFALYFFVMRTGKFIYMSMVIGLGVIALSIYNSEILTMVTDVFEGRVVNKISDPSMLQQGNVDVDQLYEDLGSGRKNLSLRYVDYLLANPYVIPLGSGFNNFILVGNSAHNIYLTLINEVGLLGLFFYVRWLVNYFRMKLPRHASLSLSLKGMVLAMMVTLLFGEHLYVYRPIFAILGLFLFATAIFISPRYYKLK
ncbi:O-antigen ligase family protein [Kordia zhangzhouensis]|uniref:O-antigen ligase family protein n=1 Tax=Kordia zhangzhouensis TaxID=1620405 RepID=UPI000629AE18|nr:O-antigen ligase family protein [Kordia zhangzhouensis]